MSTTAEVATSLMAAFADGDVETVKKLVSTDVHLSHPMTTKIWPFAGEREGRTALLEFLAGVSKATEFEKFEPVRMVVSGEHAIVVLSEHIRVRKTGRRVRHQYIQSLTVRNGKVVELRIYEDTAPIIAAIRDVDSV